MYPLTICPGLKQSHNWRCIFRGYYSFTNHRGFYVQDTIMSSIRLTVLEFRGISVAAAMLIVCVFFYTYALLHNIGQN